MKILTLVFVLMISFTNRLNTIDPKLSISDLSMGESLEESYLSYKEQADIILKNKGTKMTGQMLADAWIETKTEYDVDVPLSLALAQAKLESSYGTSKISIQKNNPYSLRGTGSYKSFTTLYEGVLAYYKIIATKYLKCNTLEDLMENFVNCSGYRYAESVIYESKVKREVSTIMQIIQ
jgi:uncharacterized FlgJ-related protein